MKQENVNLLLSLLSNYVIQASKEYPLEQVTDDVARYLDLAAKAAITPMSQEDKEKMYSDTIAALNCGSIDADECAFCIRLKALASGDNEFTDKIEYLWDVI